MTMKQKYPQIIIDKIRYLIAAPVMFTGCLLLVIGMMIAGELTADGAKQKLSRSGEEK